MHGPSKVIIPHGSGLFSNLNKVLTIAEAFFSTNFYVDWRRMNYYGDSGENVWDWLFDQGDFPQGEFTEYLEWPHHKYTWKWAADQYEGNKDWRFRLNDYLKSLKIKEYFIKESKKFFADKGSPLGVLVRASPLLRLEQPNDKMPSFEDYCRSIESVLKDGQRIFLMTDNDEDLNKFRDKYGEKLFFREHARSYSSHVEFHTNFSQSRSDVEECFLEAICLSQCETFIHPVSNIATFALYCNPELNHYFLKAS